MKDLILSSDKESSSEMTLPLITMPKDLPGLTPTLDLFLNEAFSRFGVNDRNIRNSVRAYIINHPSYQKFGDNLSIFHDVLMKQIPDLYLSAVAHRPFVIDSLSKLLGRDIADATDDVLKSILSRLNSRIAPATKLADAIGVGYLASKVAPPFNKKPRVGYTVTSPFGERHVKGASHSHKGIDLVGPRNALIHTPVSGMVTDVGTSPSAGKYVSIRDGVGRLHSFFHLSSYSVAPGDRIAAGSPIGRQGATGKVVSTKGGSGEHLHYQVSSGTGTFLDPAKLVNIQTIYNGGSY